MTGIAEGGLGAFDLEDPPSVDGLRACVHCGICLPQCPTFRVLAEEMDSPRGRIYLMRAASEGRIELTPTFARHLDLCLGCRACETACPSGVPFGQLLEATRGQLARRGVRAPATDHRTLAFALGIFPYPGRLGPMLAALGLYQRSGLGTLVRALGILRPFKKLQAMEALLPRLPARVHLPEVTPPAGKRQGRVGMLTGCVQRFFYPDVNRDTARLLAAAGYEVVAPRSQGCCGALHLHAGRIDEFRTMARRLIGAFDPQLDLIVVNAAGCGSALKEYGHWLPGAAGAGLRGQGPRRLRGAGRAGAAAARASRHGGLSRCLPPPAWAASEIRATRAVEADPRPHPAGSERRRDLLRQRGPVQPARARDRRRAGPPKGRAHPGGGSAHRRQRQSRVLDADCPAVPGARHRRGSRPPSLAAGSGSRPGTGGGLDGPLRALAEEMRLRRLRRRTKMRIESHRHCTDTPSA